MDIYTARQVYREQFTEPPSKILADFKKDKWFMTHRQQAYWIEQIRAYRAIWKFKYPYWNVLHGSLQS